MSNIVITPDDYNRDAGHRDVAVPDGFDEPFSSKNKRFDRPFKIGNIEATETFDGCAFASREQNDSFTAVVKKPNELNCDLSKKLSQFSEFLQKAVDYEEKNSPLYPYKRGMLIVRAFKGGIQYPAQPFHYDPSTASEGNVYNLYSAVSRLGTEFSDGDSKGFVNDYELNFFSMRCRHRQPVIPVGCSRVFASVAFYMSKDETVEVQQKHSLSPRAFDTIS